MLISILKICVPKQMHRLFSVINIHVNKNCTLSNHRHENLKIPKNLQKVTSFFSTHPFILKKNKLLIKTTKLLIKTNKLEDTTVSEQCRFFRDECHQRNNRLIGMFTLIFFIFSTCLSYDKILAVVK